MKGTPKILFALIVCLGLIAFSSAAQTGNSSTISGTVTDSTAAVVAGAAVTIHNPVSGFERSTVTDSAGNFVFPNVPFNPYHLSIDAKGFSSYTQDIEVRSSVPLSLKSL